MENKNEIEQVESNKVLPVMNKEEAEKITKSIQSTAIATCVLLQRAHDQQAWKALGYESWKDYIDKEFKFSRGRSYQLLQQGSVIKEIADASQTDIYLTEKEAKAIKKELPNITEKVKQDTAEIKDPEERKQKAKDIVDEAVDNEAKQDNKNFEASIENDEQDTDDYQGQGGNAAAASPELAAKHQEVEDKKQTSFYISNLNHTLAIFQALPTADSISESAEMSKDNKIKMINDIEYAITWLNEFKTGLDKD